MATNGKIFETALAQGSDPQYLRAVSSDGKSVKVLASRFAKQTSQTQIDTRVTTLEGEVDELQETLPAQVTQIGSKIGDLTQLETDNKTSVVDAMNEIDSKITPSISSTEIAIDIDGTKAASIEHFDSSLFDNVPTYDEVHDIVEEEVVDSFDSDATNKPLSASKGKELNGRITPEISYVGGISTDIDGTKSVSPEYFDSSLLDNVPTFDDLVDVNSTVFLLSDGIHIPQWPNVFYTFHPLWEEVILTSNNKLINLR